METIEIEQIDNAYIRVTSEPAVEQELREYFTFEVPGAKFQPKVKAGIWDGRIRLFNVINTLGYMIRF